MAIAKEFNLFLIADEIYINITYNGARAYSLAEIIEDVPGISMKGISKELPWPGARCGWMEYYNRDKDEDFNRFCNVLDNAKMIEVCSTKLPQLAIPKIFGDPRFKTYREQTNQNIGRSSKDHCRHSTYRSRSLPSMKLMVLFTTRSFSAKEH